MKRILLIYVCALFSVLMFSSCGADDIKVHADVQNALVEKNLSVEASVRNGVVALSGEVASEADKTTAEESAKSISGVKSVVNDIVVKTPPPAVVNTDETLAVTVTEALVAAGFKDVKADVKAGVVTLTGKVKKADVSKIMQIAGETKPIKVENELTMN